MAHRWRVDGHYTAKGRDREYERLKAKGFEVRNRQSLPPTKFRSKTLYIFEWRFPKSYPLAKK